MCSFCISISLAEKQVPSGLGTNESPGIVRKRRFGGCITAFNTIIQLIMLFSVQTWVAITILALQECWEGCIVCELVLSPVVKDAVHVQSEDCLGHGSIKTIQLFNFFF